MSNGKFVFKDIMAFLAPGTSLSQYLKAFDTIESKVIFPHKITQNINDYVNAYPKLRGYNGVIEILKHSKMPTINRFYDEFRKKHIKKVEYHHIVSRYQNLYELPRDYNNCDVIPSVEATYKLSYFFKNLGLNIHKDGISVSGLMLKYLWKLKEPNCEFKLFKGNEVLYHKYKNNLVGGPSIVFNHYHERNKTLIRNKTSCKKILGYDANALYLRAIGQNMLCGDHKVVEPYTILINDVENGNFFGVVECDIKVPDNLLDYFSEMAPIFKNIEITFDDISHETKQQVNPNYKNKKLVGSMFGKKMLFHTDLLRWYIRKGSIVNNVTYAVQYEKKSPFKTVVEEVSDARRAGDRDVNYKVRGEMMKLMGNSSYGKCFTNFVKHERVKIVPENKYDRNVLKNAYKSHEDLIEGFEFRFKMTSFKQNIPIKIGFAVYQLAKLRMLQFYYDFFDFHIDRSDFQYCGMDTDSAYIAISAETLKELVKPELKTHFKENSIHWFGRKDTFENELYDKGAPGLFKLEYTGDGIIALASKMYYCFGAKDKFSSNGISQKQNDLTKQKYPEALNGNQTQQFKNIGFRVKQDQISTYSLTKFGMKLFNDKRLRSGTETLPPLV